jgi:hypothetical protein
MSAKPISNIENLILKMDALCNAFVILGYIIDIALNVMNTHPTAHNRTKLEDDMCQIKGLSFSFVMFMYDLLSYLNAELMNLKYSKPSLYYLRTDINGNTSRLYLRTNSNQPYCDMYYSEKFPVKDYTLNDRFHTSYEKLENIYNEVRVNFLFFIKNQRCFGNDFTLIQVDGIYNLHEGKKPIFDIIKKMNKNSNSKILIPIYSVESFFKDYSITLNKKLDSLIFYNITFYKKNFDKIKTLSFSDLGKNFYDYISNDNDLFLYHVHKYFKDNKAIIDRDAVLNHAKKVILIPCC